MKRGPRGTLFRAWDTVNKTMYTNPFNGKIGGLNDILSNTGNWIYMQYIGKEDKEGTQTFEGDIVKASSDHKINIQSGAVTLQRSFEIGEIIYNPEDSRYEVLVWKQLEACYDNKIPYPRPLRYHPRAIIGNIYENPELIKQR